MRYKGTNQQQHSNHETSSCEVPSDTNDMHAPSVSGAASSICDPKLLEQALKKIVIWQLKTPKIVDETKMIQNYNFQLKEIT